MEQIGVGMTLVGFTGILIIVGKWFYEVQGVEGIALYTSGVMILIGTLLATAVVNR